MVRFSHSAPLLRILPYITASHLCLMQNNSINQVTLLKFFKMPDIIPELRCFGLKGLSASGLK